MINATLNGLLPTDFVTQGRLISTMKQPSKEATSALVTIYNARMLQAAAGESIANFFERYGFVLLSHHSKVQNWDSTKDIANIYLSEVEALIRAELLNDLPVEIQQTQYSFMRRGEGTLNPFYGLGVHQDYGMSADDYQENLEAYTNPEVCQTWRDRYEQNDVAGFMTINFWRPVNMSEPLRHMPLALCDPNTVDSKDALSSGLMGFTQTGKVTNQMSLRFNPKQKWYYYPNMTGDEVLVFKNFQCFKGDNQLKLRSCFHTAFVEPEAPEDAEKRQSCEHRVSVFCLNE